jgi:hypothetical protein
LWGCGFDPSGSGWGIVAFSSDHGNEETSDSINGREFLDQMSEKGPCSMLHGVSADAKDCRKL